MDVTVCPAPDAVNANGARVTDATVCLAGAAVDAKGSAATGGLAAVGCFVPTGGPVMTRVVTCAPAVVVLPLACCCSLLLTAGRRWTASRPAH
jgi:hypothetical protein